MPKLARISGGETIRKLEKLGFKIARQRGSHVILKKRRLHHYRKPRILSFPQSPGGNPCFCCLVSDVPERGMTK